MRDFFRFRRNANGRPEVVVAKNEARRNGQSQNSAWQDPVFEEPSLDGETEDDETLKIAFAATFGRNDPEIVATKLWSPYWSVIATLTASSAWLLLSKPRPAKSHVATVTGSISPKEFSMSTRTPLTWLYRIVYCGLSTCVGAVLGAAAGVGVCGLILRPEEAVVLVTGVKLGAPVGALGGLLLGIVASKPRLAKPPESPLVGQSDA